MKRKGKCFEKFVYLVSPFPVHLDGNKTPAYNFHFKVSFRTEVSIPWSRQRKVLPSQKLFGGLEVGEGGVGVGQADQGGEVQVGGHRL